MLLFVIGRAGRFAEFCAAVTAAMAESVLGHREVTRADTLDEIARELLRRGVSHGVVAAHQPGGRLRRALLESGRPFIVALDDPRAALAELVVGRGMELPEATRIVASSCAASLCFRAMPGALVLQADPDGRDLRSLAGAIARHLRLDADNGAIADIVAGLGDAAAAADPETGAAWWAAWWKDLGHAEQAIASGALDAYLDLAPDGELARLSWAPELFFLGSRPTERVSGAIDITGRVRCLLRGPRILLSPGNWSLSVALDVSPEAAEHSFLLEVTAGAALGRASIEPREPGVVRAELALALADLPDQPIELALSNERPAFAGHLNLFSVTLTRQPATSEPAIEMSEGSASSAASA